MLHHPHNFRRGFTIMEMIVSIGILVMVILSVGVIFQNAGRTVGVSQSSMEMLSGVRAIQQQLESDISGLDRNGFLVIRCAQYTDPATGATRRCDQISFLARGSFVNRTGTNSGFTDNNTTVPAAHVWWGQLAIQKMGGDNSQPTVPSVYLNAASPDYRVPLNQVPTGTTEGDIILGRVTRLLVSKTSSTNNISPAGAFMGSYPNQVTTAPNLAAIDYYNPVPVGGISAESALYNITQSRVSVAQATPAQVMGFIVGNLGFNRPAADARYEADHFCYRTAALRSPLDGVNLVNGYFRMHPIALQGVSSFAIDWTDGSLYNGTEIDVTTGQTVSSSLANTTRWFGMYDGTQGLSKGIAYSNDAATSVVDRASGGATVTFAAASNDKYAAIFSYDNKQSNGNQLWPVALRFRYHIADPSARLQGGRDFVEVVKLPD